MIATDAELYAVWLATATSSATDAGFENGARALYDRGRADALAEPLQPQPIDPADIKAAELIQSQPAPIVLPTAEEVASVIEDSDAAEPTPGDRRDPYQRNARAVLALIASRVHHWVPVEPGTVIKAGTHYRIEYGDGCANERVSSFDRTVDDSAPVSIDPATVPAEPEDPRVAAVMDWLRAVGPEDGGLDDALELLARIDALEADR